MEGCQNQVPCLFEGKTFAGCQNKISENATLRKMVAVIPIIGTPWALRQEYSLFKKICRVSENDSSYLIKLIKTKNIYKNCGMLSTVLLIIMIAGISFALLNTLVGWGLVGMAFILGGGFIASQISHQYKNRSLLSQLEKNQVVPSSNYLKQTVF